MRSLALLLNVSLYIWTTVVGQQIAAGYWHTCIVTSERKISCWGDDYDGIFSPPVGIEFAQVTGMERVLCGLDVEGRAYCWGDAIYGGIVDGVDSNARFVDLTVGDVHACGIHLDRTISCWGTDSSSREGNRNISGMPKNGERFHQLAAGFDFTLGITEQGLLRAWGPDRNIINETRQYETEHLVVYVSAGDVHGCALLSNGSVRCFGLLSTPDQAILDGQFSQISAGWGSTCGITLSGDVRCFGKLAQHMANLPVDKKFSTVATGGEHACALTRSGNIACFSKDSVDNRVLGVPPSDTFVQVSVVSDRACGVTTMNAIECWGKSLTLNNYSRASMLIPMPTGLTWKFVSVADNWTCGITTNGTCYCWGIDDAYASLANTPIDVQFHEVAAKVLCGVSFEGAIVCWKLNLNQDANYTMTNDRYTHLYASYTHPRGSQLPSWRTFAINSAGRIIVFGLSPPPHPGNVTFISASAIFNGYCATMSNLTLFCAPFGSRPIRGMPNNSMLSTFLYPKGSALSVLAPSSENEYVFIAILNSKNLLCWSMQYFTVAGDEDISGIVNGCPILMKFDSVSYSSRFQSSVTRQFACGILSPGSKWLLPSIRMPVPINRVYCWGNSGGAMYPSTTASVLSAPANSFMMGNQIMPCSNGTYSLENGYTSPLCANFCSKGEYRDASVTVCTDCEEGWFCPDGSLLEYGKTRMPCPAGKYQSRAGQTTCDSCVPGRAQSQTAATECMVCLFGKFAASYGSESCNDCPIGSYQPYNASVSCIPCSPGRYVNAISATICQFCETGRFRNYSHPVASNCLECPFGKLQPNLGGTECFPCNGGYYYNGSTCTPCLPGSSRLADSVDPARCEPCEEGRYQNNLGSVTCIVCPPGRFSARLGLVECSECAIGRYRNDTTADATVCPECPVGKFQARTGGVECSVCSPGQFYNLTGCSPCAPGTVRPGNNASSLLLCEPCSVGEYQPNSESVRCIPCAIGRFASKLRQTECTACPPGQFQSSLGASACHSCPVGRYNNVHASGICSVCADGTTSISAGSVDCKPCSRGWLCASGSAKLAIGFWAIPLASNITADIAAVEAFPCPEGQCTGNNIEISCGRHRLDPPSENVLCGQCSEGYSEIAGDCVLCESPNYGLLTLAYFGVVLFVAFTHHNSQKSSGRFSSFLYFIQTALLMLGSSIKSLSFFNVFNFSPQDSAGPTCFLPMGPFLKLALNFIMPICFLVQLLLQYSAHLLCIRVSSSRDTSVSKRPYFRSAIALYLFSYTKVALSVTIFMRCQEVGPYSVVYLAPAIHCTDGHYHLWFPVYVVVLMVYLVGVPCCFMWWLHKHRGLIALEDKQLSQPWGILYEPYHSEAYFIAPVVLVRRALMVAANIIFILKQETRIMTFSLLNFAFLVIHVWLRPYKVDNSNHLETALLSVLLVLSTILSLPDRPLSVESAVVVFLLISGSAAFCVCYFTWTEIRKRWFDGSAVKKDVVELVSQASTRSFYLFVLVVRLSCFFRTLLYPYFCISTGGSITATNRPSENQSSVVGEKRNAESGEEVD